MSRSAACLVLLPTIGALVLPGAAVPIRAAATAAPRCRLPIASDTSPLSVASLDCLFRYGPVVYSSRCFDSDEYIQSVENLMSRYPRITRDLAEQEIHEFLTDANGYLARTTAKGYKGPQDADLKPPVGVIDKLLVVAWVIVLVPAVNFIGQAAMDAPPVDRSWQY